MKPGWRTAPCMRCFGYGVIGQYGQADDCPDCQGSGVMCISPLGRIADYPGGPFRGYASEADIAAARPLSD